MRRLLYKPWLRQGTVNVEVPWRADLGIYQLGPDEAPLVRLTHQQAVFACRAWPPSFFWEDDDEGG